MKNQVLLTTCSTTSCPTFSLVISKQEFISRWSGVDKETRLKQTREALERMMNKVQLELDEDIQTSMSDVFMLKKE